MLAGRKRSLGDAAAEAAAFWRSCASHGDRWADLEPAGRRSFIDGLERALRALPAQSALLAAGDFFDLPQAPFRLLRSAAQRFDCTALVARDPWRDDFPLSGFVFVRDLETRATRRIFAGRRERSNFMRRAAAREDEMLRLFARAGWRAAPFDEREGARAVLRAFAAT
jgi:molybdopterin-guanine dinucleotide biosynthesis protein A